MYYSNTQTFAGGTGQEENMAGVRNEIKCEMPWKENRVCWRTNRVLLWHYIRQLKSYKNIRPYGEKYTIKKHI